MDVATRKAPQFVSFQLFMWSITTFTSYALSGGYRKVLKPVRGLEPPGAAKWIAMIKGNRISALRQIAGKADFRIARDRFASFETNLDRRTKVTPATKQHLCNTDCAPRAIGYLYGDCDSLGQVGSVILQASYGVK
jgi:hypothetical protein